MMTEVVAALIWEGERFLICQRPAHKARGLLWEFVGGKVEPGETPEQALARECREELDALWQTLAATVPLTLPDPETDMVPVEKTLLLTNPTAAQPSAPVVWNRLCQLMDTAEERLWMVSPYLVMDPCGTA